MKPRQLRKYLNICAGKNVLVIGDCIRDVAINCKVRGVSENSPSMVLETLSVQETQGGAGCVYRNLQALGAKPTPLMPEHHERPLKVRYWVGDHKVIGADTFPKKSRKLTRADVDRHRSIYPDQIVVVSDYRHGWIESPEARYIVATAPEHFFVASQAVHEDSNHAWYMSKKAVFVMNENEYVGLDLDKFLYHPDSVVTLGNHGARKFDHLNLVMPIAVKAVDTSGAGDAFLAAYALTQSLEFANLWAGLSCTIRGANPPTIEMARAWVEEHPS